MLKGDLNEDRWEVKHDGAQIVRNVWKAQPLHKSKGVHQTGLKRGMLRGNDPQLRQQGHSVEGLQAACLLCPAPCPAGMQGLSNAGFDSCQLPAKPRAVERNETPPTAMMSGFPEGMRK